MAALIQLNRLTAALDWELSAAELADAEDALEYASELVRAHGQSSWDESNAPQMAKSIVLAACKRYMRTYEGLTQSRAGDEQVQFTDMGEQSFSPYLTDTEKQTLKALVGRSGIVSAQGYAWGETSRPSPANRNYPRASDYVPIEGGGHFPMGHPW